MSFPQYIEAEYIEKGTFQGGEEDTGILEIKSGDSVIVTKQETWDDIRTREQIARGERDKLQEDLDSLVAALDGELGTKRLEGPSIIQAIANLKQQRDTARATAMGNDELAGKLRDELEAAKEEARAARAYANECDRRDTSFKATADAELVKIVELFTGKKKLDESISQCVERYMDTMRHQREQIGKLSAQVEVLTEERDRLAGWKEQQLAVFEMVNTQEIGKELGEEFGVFLGTNVYPLILPAIKAYKAQIKHLEELVERVSVEAPKIRAVLVVEPGRRTADVVVEFVEVAKLQLAESAQGRIDSAKRIKNLEDVVEGYQKLLTDFRDMLQRQDEIGLGHHVIDEIAEFKGGVEWLKRFYLAANPDMRAEAKDERL